MVSEQLLNVIMLVEVALLALAVSLFFLHGVWLHLTARRMDKLSKIGRESLARLVTRGFVNVEDVEVLKNLPHDVQNITVLEISRSFVEANPILLRVSLAARARCRLRESSATERRRTPSAA